MTVGNGIPYYGFLAAITMYPRAPLLAAWRAAWANCLWPCFRQRSSARKSTALFPLRDISTTLTTTYRILAGSILKSVQLAWARQDEKEPYLFLGSRLVGSVCGQPKACLAALSKAFPEPAFRRREPAEGVACPIAGGWTLTPNP